MKVGRLAAYVTSGALAFIGVVGLLVESSKRGPSPTNFYGYVLFILLLVCGGIIVLAVRSGYRGGAWSLLGLLLIAAAIARATSIAEIYIQGKHLLSPTASYLRTGALWGTGCYCLVWGHLRPRRKAPNNSLQATAAAPASCD